MTRGGTRSKSHGKYHHRFYQDPSTGATQIQYRSNAERCLIVEEAYQFPGNVSATARKYNLDRRSIMRWKTKQDAICTQPNKRTMHTGPLRKNGEEASALVLDLVQRHNDLATTIDVPTLAIALLAKYPTFLLGSVATPLENDSDTDGTTIIDADDSEEPTDQALLQQNRRIRSYVRRLLISLGLVERAATHVAQNAIQDSAICGEFVDHVNATIDRSVRS